jgi:hypothetical protein
MEAHEGSMKAGVDLTAGFAGLETHDRPPKAAVGSTPAQSRFIRASWSFMASW